MRHIAFIVVLLACVPAPLYQAWAQPVPPDLQMRVLGELLRDAQNREANALLRSLIAERAAASCKAPAAPAQPEPAPAPAGQN